MTKRERKRRLIFSLLPAVIVVSIIYIIPVLNTIFSAFWGYTGVNAGKFVGLGNFRLIQSDIWKTIKVTVIWTFGSVVPAIILGLIAALFCVKQFRGKKLYLTATLIPYSIPLIIVAACWTFVYNKNFGLVNVFLTNFEFIEKPIHFLGKSNALVSVIVARIWRAMPFAFINYYAALTSIPNEYYEAASVDGASKFQQLLHITLPNLKSITFTTTIVLTVWTFLVFDIIYGMTGGGPVSATTTIPLQIYREQFSMKDMGTASAWSLISIIILSIITVIYWRLFRGGLQDND